MTNRSAAVALALAASLTGCGQLENVPAGHAPLLVGSPGVARVPFGRTHAVTGTAIGAYVIAASNYCPTTTATIALNVIALSQSTGTVLTSAFDSPIILSDNDASGLTKLSRTSIANASQENLTLTFPKKSLPGPFRITATYKGSSGAASTFAAIYPNQPCVNGTPDIIRVVDGGSAGTVALAGQKAPAPYQLGTYYTGDPSAACGQAGQWVSTKPLSTTTFSVTSHITWFTACKVFATDVSGNAVTEHAVLIMK